MTYFGKKRNFNQGSTFAAATAVGKTTRVDKFSIMATQENLFVAQRNDGIVFIGYRNDMGHFMMGNDKA